MTLGVSGTVLAWVFALGGVVGSLGGLGTPASYAYPLATVAAGLVLLQSRRDVDFLELVLWTWMLSPELRRVVDWQTGWHSLSPVMVAAPLIALLGLGPALRRVGRIRLEGRVLFTVASVALGYGLLVGIVRNGVASAGADVLQWIAPMVFGLWIANGSLSAPVLERLVLRNALRATVVIAVYGLVQFFVLPAWDAAWMIAAPLASIGRPEPLEVRIYSILNSPGPMALVVMAFVVVLGGARRGGHWWGHVLGVITIALSLVRAAWVGLLAGLFFLALRSRRRVLGWVTLNVVLLGVVIAVVPPVQDLVTGRFTESVDSGTQDESLADRISFHERMLPIVMRDLVGSGLGASGVATKAGNSGALGTSGDFDGGALQLLFTYGAVVGSVFLAVLLWAVFRFWRSTRGTAGFRAACAAAVISLAVQLAFGNPMTSVTGIVLWMLLGVLAREDQDPDQEATRPAGTISSRRPLTPSHRPRT